jgi:hypothetical protein
MESMSLSARRLIIAGAFALAAAAPLVAVTTSMPSGPPSQLAACATGEDEDLYSGHCVPYLVPNSPAGVTVPGTAQCPPGVNGQECTSSTTTELDSPQPQMPAPVPPQEPEQELAEVVTPGY